MISVFYQYRPPPPYTNDRRLC